MEIQSDKYILGQSTSNIISNQDDEIRLDLSLQPNTTQLLLGPQYDSFTIASLGYIPPIITNATQGTLNGVTIASNGQFVQGFGTSYASELNLIIYTMVAGQYNLNIKLGPPPRRRPRSDAREFLHELSPESTTRHRHTPTLERARRPSPLPRPHQGKRTYLRTIHVPKFGRAQDEVGRTHRRRTEVAAGAGDDHEPGGLGTQPERGREGGGLRS